MVKVCGKASTGRAGAWKFQWTDVTRKPHPTGEPWSGASHRPVPLRPCIGAKGRWCSTESNDVCRRRTFLKQLTIWVS